MKLKKTWQSPQMIDLDSQNTSGGGAVNLTGEGMHVCAVPNCSDTNTTTVGLDGSLYCGTPASCS